MTNLGFKQITPSNWLQVDPTSAIFARITPHGGVEPMTGEDWLEAILKPVLVDGVPVEVRRLFEVARSSIVYGYFFYPLFTLCWEQLFRVADAAILHKARQIGCPSSQNKVFARRLEYLKDKNILSTTEFEWWEAIRHLRNMASHADDQSILPPGSVVDTLHRISEGVNRLFP